MAQNKITGWRYSVGGNALFKVLLDPIQLVHSDRWAKLRIGSKEALRELSGSARITIWTSSLMDRYAAEDTKSVLVLVQGGYFTFVAKPSRKAPKIDSQRLAG